MCKGLTRLAEHFGTMRVVYPMYKAVQVFYIVPIFYLYFLFQPTPLGDLFYGNSLSDKIVLAAVSAWIVGMVCKTIYYIRKYREFLWVKRKNVPIKDQMPFERFMWCLYPYRECWNRTRFCTNFLLQSPCVMGTVFPIVVLPERDYTDEEMQTIMMHEGTHIVKQDNAWKQVALVISVINWFNPFLSKCIREMDDWSELECDIDVCNKFFHGHAKQYYQVLLDTRTKGSSFIPPFVSQASREDSLRRRILRMKKWKRHGDKKITCIMLIAVLTLGSIIPAFAANNKIVDAQQKLYTETRELDLDQKNVNSDVEYVIPADEVDEEKWADAIVEEDGIDTLSVQKYFNWKIPPLTFARSSGFTKSAGSTIDVSCYIYSDAILHRVGIRQPDGSMLYVYGRNQVSHTFKCKTKGTYYVFVENMSSSTTLKASGYYVK